MHYYRFSKGRCLSQFRISLNDGVEYHLLEVSFHFIHHLRTPGDGPRPPSQEFDETGYANTIILVDAPGPFVGTNALDALTYENVTLTDYYPYGTPPDRQ